MKTPIDVVRHQQDKEINLLARQTARKDAQRNAPPEGGGPYAAALASVVTKQRIFMQITDRTGADVFPADPRTRAGRVAVALFDANEAISHFDHCVATKIARYIIDLVRKNAFPLDAGGRFCEEFYLRCVKDMMASCLLEECDDDELLHIYLKQVVMMLREAKVLVRRAGCAAISDEAYSQRGLYAALFMSFWNRVKWEDLFPSIPNAARELRRSRGILIDLMLGGEGPMRLDELTGRFFEMTGFGKRDDLYLISFIDFYFYTWLYNFGLMEYDETDDEESVRVRLTEHGLHFLRCLQSV